ncbi:hypothetical protein BD309DRAFT_984953 [Dichomitus squalens]|nr:hypothetical protein BD309DRAFT_984953 [Dichomitus squalens]
MVVVYPKVDLVKRGEVIEPYHNEDQRNIHIWALRQPLRSYIELIGGKKHDNRVTYKTLYEWLALILTPISGESMAVSAPARSKAKPNFGLAKLSTLLNQGESPKDEPEPRYDDVAFPHWQPEISEDDVVASLGEHYIKRNDTKPCLPGHYVIFCGFFNDAGVRNPVKAVDIGATPTMGMSIFTAGKVGKQTEPRNSKMRGAVQERDKYCKVTGQDFVYRGRGHDFCSLEVAHIYQFSMAGKKQLYVFEMGISSAIKDEYFKKTFEEFPSRDHTLHTNKQVNPNKKVNPNDDQLQWVPQNDYIQEPPHPLFMLYHFTKKSEIKSLIVVLLSFTPPTLAYPVFDRGDLVRTSEHSHRDKGGHSSTPMQGKWHAIENVG